MNNGEYPVRPYGDLAGWFIVDRPTYQLYRAYSFLVIIIAFVAGEWLLMHPIYASDYGWLIYFTLLPAALYGQFRIVNLGRRTLELSSSELTALRARHVGSVISFWLLLVGAGLLIALGAFSLWVDITRLGEIYGWEWVLLVVPSAAIYLSITMRRR